MKPNLGIKNLKSYIFNYNKKKAYSDKMDIPTKPELITKEWMMMVINNYRDKKNLSLLGSVAINY